jgi:hypothetical protein
VRHNPLADSSAAQIFAHAHNGTVVGSGIYYLLRQAGKPQPRAKLDELADSLAQLAIRPAGSYTAVEELWLAGAVQRSSESGPAPASAAYDGALDRLIRIHRNGTDPSTRQAALSVIPLVATHTRAIAYLRAVVTSNDPTAAFALLALARDADSTSDRSIGTSAERRVTLALLHQLWEQKLVTEPGAMGELNRIAAFGRWVRP